MAAAILGSGGEWARRTVAADAVPDLSDPQVSIEIAWPRRSPAALREKVTEIVEAALVGIPGAKAVRGISMAEIGFVYVLIDDDWTLGATRAVVKERLERVRPRLPADARATLGPDASSVGWVFQYALVDRRAQTTVAERRRLQEQILAPDLRVLPGVAEVATVAGNESALNVELDLEALARRGLRVADAVAAVRRQAATMEGRGRREALDLLREIEVAGGAGESRLGGMAHLWDGVRMTMGTANLDGTLQAVGGIVVARRDAHVPSLIGAVKARLAELGPRLPPTVEVVTTYDRSVLIANIGRTLWVALAEEALVVALVLVLFLGLAPSAGVPVVVLPLVVLATFLTMKICGVVANVMSLGGIALALGLCVDAEIVTTESCHVALAAEGTGLSRARRLEILTRTTARVAPILFVSLLIAAVSFVPMFALAEEAGRLVRPLVITKTTVVFAGAVLSLTVGPALRALLLRPRRDRALISSFAERIYRPMVFVALERPFVTALIGALAILSTVGPASGLGAEFLPELDEGDLLFMPTTLPGATMHDTEVNVARLTRQISAMREVETVFAKAGRAETATDPAPLTMIEATVRLRPHADWPTVPEPRWYSAWAPGPLRRVLRLLWPEHREQTKAELWAKLNRQIGLVGWSNALTMPIRGRVEMLTTGVRGPVGIRVVAEDAAALDRIGTAVERVLGRVPGTRRVFFERSQGVLAIDARPNMSAIATCGLDDTAGFQETLDVIVNGLEVGAVVDRGGRVPIVVRSTRLGDTLKEISRLPIACPALQGSPRALGDLAFLSKREGPSMLRTEDGNLVGYVHIDLTPEREPAAYVRDARAAIAEAEARAALVLPAASRLEWTGQHDVATRTRHRLAVLIPLALIAVALLLYALFHSVAKILIILATVPFALVGAVWSLYVLDYRLSIAVWIGAVALVGLAVQTGVVMMLYLDEAYRERAEAGQIRTREDVAAAHMEGAVGRLRPKLMTLATMTLALAPLLVSDGAGAEVMKRIAAPMFGGLFSSAFLTLEILPVLTTW